MGREDQLINQLALRVPSVIGRTNAASSPRGGIRLGIGDDAAVVVARRNTDLVLTCDAFLEGIHFLPRRHPPDSVGYKSLARATSDIAALGAKPRFFLLTLAIPQSLTGKWLTGLLHGMRHASRELGAELIGGDTTRSTSVSISITVGGEIASGRAITRSGARPGDLLYVTGKLGRAQLGLEIIRSCPPSRVKRVVQSQSQHLRQHLYPHVRVALGEWLAKRRIASAMIDISDGLSTDLSHLCTASGVGARVWSERIPQPEIPPSQSGFALKRALDPLQMALHGGDDYELLFTVPRRLAKRLQSAPEFRDITAIGEINRGKQVLLIDSAGHAKPLKPAGWDPFRVK